MVELSSLPYGFPYTVATVPPARRTCGFNHHLLCCQVGVGIRGAVIHPSKGEFGKLEVSGNLLSAGAGVRFKKVASFVQCGLVVSKGHLLN